MSSALRGGREEGLAVPGFAGREFPTALAHGRDGGERVVEDLGIESDSTGPSQLAKLRPRHLSYHVTVPVPNGCVIREGDTKLLLNTPDAVHEPVD